MTTRLDRRSFLTAAGCAWAGFVAGSARNLAAPARAGRRVDLAVAHDSDPAAATRRALATVLGGAVLVGRGSTVVVNANTAFTRRGSIVRPEVLVEVLRRCWSHGAARVELVKDVPDGYWNPVAGDPEAEELIRRTGRCSRRMHDVPLPAAGRLAAARSLVALREADHLVNVSIAKDHDGVRFSGALKNAMGLTAFRPTNLFCHRGADPDRTETNVDHLAACIAELNLLRRPDVHVLDATEFLVTNGPYGPGKLGRADVVIASRDPVAADVRAMAVVGRSVAEVPVIRYAVGLGLGVAELSSLAVVEPATASG